MKVESINVNLSIGPFFCEAAHEKRTKTPDNFFFVTVGRM
jgi:hypothetical protein